MTVYLDNNATTRVDPAVFESMRPYFCEFYGNPSSIHKFGGQVGQAVEAARASVARLLNCLPEEIVFTAGGSEGDNMAIRGVLDALGGKKRHVVISRVEHPGVRSLCHQLERRGIRVTEIGVDANGHLDMTALEEALDAETAIVSVMWANNETGVIYPVEKIAAMCRARGIVFHTDAVQAVGKIPIDLKNSSIDILSLSGHKLHAPKGIGAIYIRKGTKVAPLIIGGHQEHGKRAGTENVPCIVALGKACELALQHMEHENTVVRAMRDRLETGLLQACEGARVNGQDPRLPNTLNISFEFIEGESILLMLDELGICASSGSACTSGSLEPSHVLRAMGVPFTCVHGSIRFSLSRMTTPAEIELVIREMPRIVNRLREISPFKAGDAITGI